ncbi:DUF4269 domain-containing protein [Tenuibacillus multivorans]|uniref:DUF4269 domain-containing protein n=1 Tax=Tenuibacillus multivorans TaxID=237069 RepID=UPI001FDF1ABC|nr:DUF4269 domain-containing protein [Tenuibacillus multivorans]
MLEDLSEYQPTLCGTVPLGINIEGSDLDMVIEVHDFDEFEQKLTRLYSREEGFRVKRFTVRGVSTIKANFYFRGFEFELFGQPQPIHKQYAYLHMVIEDSILKQRPELKEKIYDLKTKGYKTEPAFCKLLELSGDPYEALLDYGVKNKLLR